MSTKARLAALEAEVERIKAQLRPASSPTREAMRGRTSPDFLDTMVGIHANSPLFEEMTRQIEATRELEREEARRLDLEVVWLRTVKHFWRQHED